MDSVQHTASFLAATFVAGRFDTESLVERGSLVLAKRGRWLRPLAGRLARTYAGKIRPCKTEIVAFLLADTGFGNAYANDRIQFANLMVPPPAMVPAEAATNWPGIPELTTPRELSQWLGLSLRQLAWFADRKELVGKQQNPKLRHYWYRLLEKRHAEYRLIEAPKPRLKAIQRQILEGILVHVPPHEASHGFRRGRSIVSFAEPHVGRAVVVKMDLQDFFPSITAPQIQAIFRFLGYPEVVADLLTGLCTSITPSDVWPSSGQLPQRHVQQTIRLYSQPHLPQGAPTSPALANLCTWRMDLRLAALAKTLDATYTRYADDLAFSGDQHFARASRRFVAHAAAIAIDHDYRVHFRKTRIMKQSARQKLAGIVVNQRLSIPRKDVDNLKAILTNCVRHGPSSQNHAGCPDYRSHLEGRVSFVEQVHAERGKQLRAILHRIDWSA